MGTVYVSQYPWSETLPARTAVYIHWPVPQSWAGYGGPS